MVSIQPNCENQSSVPLPTVFFSLFSPFPFHPIRSLKKCFLLKTFYDFVELKGNLIGDTLNYFVSAMVLLNGK